MGYNGVMFKTTNIPLLGVSFSHIYLWQHHIPIEVAFEHYIQLGFKLIRISLYWSEIEKIKGVYDFSAIDKLLEKCKQYDRKVILTVGMKAPRWPEYYFPDWILEKQTHPIPKYITKDNKPLIENLFLFIQHAITHLKTNREIIYWQVENEPLDESGPKGLIIDEELLKKEVDFVRNMDSRPILITVWGNELSKRNNISTILSMADIVGLDFYPKVPVKTWFNRVIYKGPSDSNKKLISVIRQIKDAGKKVFISELQAEPWGQKESCTADQVIQNIKWAKQYETDGILLWGFEYWVSEKLKGRNEYWNVFREMKR